MEMLVAEIRPSGTNAYAIGYIQTSSSIYEKIYSSTAADPRQDRNPYAREPNRWNQSATNSLAASTVSYPLQEIWCQKRRARTKDCNVVSGNIVALPVQIQ